MEEQINSMENFAPESKEVLESTGMGLLLVMMREGIPNYIHSTYEANGEVYDLTFTKRKQDHFVAPNKKVRG